MCRQIRNHSQEYYSTSWSFVSRKSVNK
jgi:hypothetical protein